MSRMVSIIAVVLLAVGVWQSLAVYRFVTRASPVSATVIGVEVLRGPPKPRQRTPVRVAFSLPDGVKREAATHLPMLQVIKTGDIITVLVDPLHPERVALPLWSELWARSLTYMVGGVLVGILGFALSKRDWR